MKNKLYRALFVAAVIAVGGSGFTIAHAKTEAAGTEALTSLVSGTVEKETFSDAESMTESAAESMAETAVIVEPLAEVPAESTVESAAESMAEAVEEPETDLEWIEVSDEPASEPQRMTVSSEEASAIALEEERGARTYRLSADGGYQTLLTTGNYRVGIDLPAGCYQFLAVCGEGTLRVYSIDPVTLDNVDDHTYHFILPPEVDEANISNDVIRIHTASTEEEKTSAETEEKVTLADVIRENAEEETAVSEAVGWELEDGMILQIRSNLILKLVSTEADEVTFCKRVQDIEGTILLEAGQYTVGEDIPVGVYDICSAGADTEVRADAGEGNILSFRLAGGETDENADSTGSIPSSGDSSTAENASATENASVTDSSVTENESASESVPSPDSKSGEAADNSTSGTMASDSNPESDSSAAETVCTFRNAVFSDGTVILLDGPVRLVPKIRVTAQS